jgi:hypothetical protein
MTDYFAEVRVRRLDATGFQLDTMTPTALKHRLCSLVLGCDLSTRRGQDLYEIWEDLSSEVAGVNFLVVDTRSQQRIMQAFIETYNDENNPITDFTLSADRPTVLVYRDGWPQAYYNGSLSFDAVRSFALDEACSSSYKNRGRDDYSDDEDNEQVDEGILSERELYRP